MALGKLTAALLLLAVAAPATLASPAAHLHIRIKSAASATNASSNAMNTTVAANATATAADITVPSIAQVVAVNSTQYKIAACTPQTWNISRANATAVWLDFASINAPGDQVIVSALNGSHPQVFNVTSNGTSTKPIAGKGVRIEFRPSPKEASPTGCAATGKLPSFVLSSVSYGLPKAVTKEEVCGASELFDVTCVSNRLGGAEKPVMRMLYMEGNVKKVCTAWLWGDKGHVITNNHCVPDKERLTTAQFQFGVEVSKCGENCDPLSCKIGEELTGKHVSFITTDTGLDVTVMQITKDPYGIAKKYGYFQIRDGEPKKGEDIALVQHPGGKSKRVAMDMSNLPDDIKANPFSIINGIMNLLRFPKVTNVVRSNNKAARVEYMADTEHGSSGSPLVKAGTKTVIALHKSGGCPNWGIASNLLADRLRTIVINSENNGLTK